MKDIARDLGLSVITVSKALRDHSDISAKTRLVFCAGAKNSTIARISRRVLLSPVTAT